ncbi:MAG: DUF1501 domain-containing protein [Planctomycetia bacterium]|nr:DUF1501 domain-containing protein [Planctomycetia bacterium]
MLPDVNRRHFLQFAAGCGLSFALPGTDLRAAARRGAERHKSLLVIWLDGGPSQLETWDPHPSSRVGGPTRAIATAAKDIEIAEGFPRIAEKFEHLSIVRSLVSPEGDHARGAYAVKTGYRPDPVLRHPSLGAIVARELPNPELEIPQIISLGYHQWPSRGGYLGNRYDAFQVKRLGLTARQRATLDAREQRKLDNLNILSESFARGRRAIVADTLHDEHVQTVVKMLNSEHAKAFQIDDEPAAVQTAYGDSDVGRTCLVARRLIEVGVSVVEVAMSGFDTHERNFLQVAALAAQLDPALAALIADLVARDLWESTLLLCLGEFGRTPHINPKDGRDHWPSGFSCLLGGGGLRGGTVVGSTDPSGEKTKPDAPVKVADLYTTVLSAFGIDPEKKVVTPIGRPMKYSEGTPIEALL